MRAQVSAFCLTVAEHLGWQANAEAASIAADQANGDVRRALTLFQVCIC